MMEFLEIWHPLLWGLFKCVVLLSVALFIIIRSQKRLAAGWKKVDADHPILPTIRQIGFMLLIMSCGAMMHEEFGLNSTFLFLLGLILAVLGNWKVWVPPVKNPNQEIEQGH